MSICYIDIIDKCNLRCPTCGRGAKLLKNSAALMSLELFEKIVVKSRIEEYDAIGLYNWIEPFLSKTLSDYVSIVKKYGLICVVSSNFSLKPTSYFNTIQQALVAGIDDLCVSVSGYQQAIYAIDHVGGNISWVKENLERVALLKRENIISTKVSLRFLKFDYNTEEESALKKFAESLDFDFEVITGIGHPNHSVDKFASENFYIDRLKNFTTSKTHEKNGEICPLIMDTIPINTQGDIYLCCLHPNYSSLRIGPYLERSKDDILLQRYTHPICNSCNFPRRQATKSDCNRLVNAIKFRLDHSEQGISTAELEPDLRLLVDMPSSRNQLREENAALQASVSDLQKAVDSLKTSTSWKFTKPLRFLSRLMRGRYLEAFSSIRQRSGSLQ